LNWHFAIIKAALNYIIMENFSESVIKIVITGDSGVGKTNLVTRYVNDIFNEFSNPTVGLDFALKTTVVAGNQISCQIWDTAGQEKMQAIANAYYKNAKGAILVFDISSKASFMHLPNWLQELQNNESLDDVSIILLGNKADMSEKREVALEEAVTFAESNGFYYMEVSAKSNDNDCVTLAFDQLLAEIHSKMMKKHKENKNPVESFSTYRKNSKIDITTGLESERALGKKGCC
jgi:small GTP-binding protein